MSDRVVMRPFVCEEYGAVVLARDDDHARVLLAIELNRMRASGRRPRLPGLRVRELDVREPQVFVFRPRRRRRRRRA